jgi:hypothetical protein
VGQSSQYYVEFLSILDSMIEPYAFKPSAIKSSLPSGAEANWHLMSASVGRHFRISSMISAHRREAFAFSSIDFGCDVPARRISLPVAVV